MRSLRITLYIGAMFFIFLPSALRAQQPDCSKTNYPDDGERLRCKHERVLGEQGRLINNLESRFGQLIPGGSIERLRGAHGRATNAKGRMTSRHFKSLAKKNPACYTAAAPGWDANLNGICDPGDKCLAKDGVSICKVKGRNVGDCAEFCPGVGDEETMEDEVDQGALSDLEGNYDDVTKSLEAANEALENNPQLASMAGRSLLAASEPADSCKASTDWLTYANVLTVTILKQVSVGARGVADILERGCDQTGGGFNCATCCIVAEGIASVSALATETTDGIFNLIRWGMDNSKQSCMSSLSADLQEAKTKLGSLETTTSGNSGQLDGVKTDVENIKTTVNNLTTKVNALSTTVNAVQQRTTELFETMNNRFNNVETILNTPQGRRDNFPSQK